MCDPASSIVKRLAAALAHGAPAAQSDVSLVAAALGLARPTVWKWKQPKGRSGGTGGLIPQRHHRPILDLARALCVPLTAADFLPASSPPARAAAAGAPASAANPAGASSSPEAV